MAISKKAKPSNTVEPVRLFTKFRERIFVPRDVIDPRFYSRGVLSPVPDFITNDDIRVSAEFQMTVTDVTGAENEIYDDICMNVYGIPFITVYSIWKSRLPKVDSVWYLISLKRNDG